MALLNGAVYARYGREALAATSSLLVAVSSIRLMDTVNLLTPTTGRTVNGILSVVVLLILVLITLNAQAHWRVRNGG